MVFVLFDARNGIWEHLHSFSSWISGSQESHSVSSQSVVMSADSQSGKPQLEFYGWPIFDSRFMKFVFRIGRWGHEILRFEDSDTGDPISIAVRIECLFTIFVPIPMCELCLKNDEGKAKSIIKWGGWGGSSLHGKNEDKFMTPLEFHHYKLVKSKCLSIRKS